MHNAKSFATILASHNSIGIILNFSAHTMLSITQYMTITIQSLIHTRYAMILNYVPVLTVFLHISYCMFTGHILPVDLHKSLHFECLDRSTGAHQCLHSFPVGGSYRTKASQPVHSSCCLDHIHHRPTVGRRGLFDYCLDADR